MGGSKKDKKEGKSGLDDREQKKGVGRRKRRGRSVEGRERQGQEIKEGRRMV